MNITMLSVGSIGDVLPLIQLGKELQKRKHRIKIAAFPQFGSTVIREGLAFFPLDGDAETMIASIMKPDTSALTYLPRLLKNIHSVIPGLIRSMQESCSDADAMICNFFGTVYYSIAELFGLPCVQINFFPVNPTRDMPMSSVRNQHLGSYANIASYKLGFLMISMIEKYYLSDWRKESHLSSGKIRTGPAASVGSHDVPILYAISPSLLPRPAEWGSNIHITGFLFDESPCAWVPPTRLADFMTEGAPPVYIGFGSMNAGNMNRLLTVVLRAVRTSGIRAVINLGHTGRDFPSTQRVLFTKDFIPHDWLFPRVSAVIHHGGLGTTASGLRYGRPTLVIPFAGDQPFWGSLVYKSGCGPKPIPRDKLNVRNLTRGILELLSRPRYAVNAQALAAQISREHGTAAAADLAEKAFRDW